MVAEGFPGGSVVKNPPANAGDVGSIPVLGRSPGDGNDNPFQDSCLGNPMDRGAWQDTVHWVTKSHTGPSDKYLCCCFLCCLVTKKCPNVLQPHGL